MLTAIFNRLKTQEYVPGDAHFTCYRQRQGGYIFTTAEAKRHTFFPLCMTLQETLFVSAGRARRCRWPAPSGHRQAADGRSADPASISRAPKGGTGPFSQISRMKSLRVKHGVSCNFCHFRSFFIRTCSSRHGYTTVLQRESTWRRLQPFTTLRFMQSEGLTVHMGRQQAVAHPNSHHGEEAWDAEH